eukprot:m.205453 g.205453  ORF g.205453 m.205453 type:complete len:1103 (+) comp26047_c3_seq4:941-4249(+)
MSNILKIGVWMVEAGDICAIRIGSKVKIREIIEMVGKKLNMASSSLPHFAICVRSSHQPPVWPKLDSYVDDKILDAASKGNLMFQVRFFPKRPAQLYAEDPPAGRYLQEQLHRRLVAGEIHLVSTGHGFQLAAIEMVKYLLLLIHKQGKTPQQTTADKILKYLRQQQGFDPFLPPIITKSIKMPAIVQEIERLFPGYWALPAEQVIPTYLDTFIQERSTLQETFEAKISLPGGIQNSKLIVCPQQGVLAQYGTGNPSLISDFDHISQVYSTLGKIELYVRGTVYAETIIMTTPADAISFGSLVDGYVLLFTDAKHSILRTETAHPNFSSGTGTINIHASYGKISRWEAEGLLKSNGCKNGLYLVRESVSSEGAYGLSVCHRGEICHYKVEKFPSGKYGIQDGLRYLTLEKLIEHYHEESDGLACVLKENVMQYDKSMAPQAPPRSSRATYDAPEPTATLKAAIKLDSASYVYDADKDTAPPRPPKSATLGKGAKLSMPGRRITLADIEIPAQQLVLGDKLGEGEFGEVVQGVLQAPGKAPVSVAVKVLKAKGGDQTLAFMTEANSMVTLDHPNIVRLLGVCTKEPMKLITELVPLGALNKYLRKNKTTLVLDHLLNFVSQIAEGMSYLERMHFVHRDLAARNILVASQSLVKISDFGLSRPIQNYYTSERKGKWPIKWYAPECIYFSKFTHKSDVWSFGVTTWEVMMYGKKPYKGLTGKQVVEALEEGGRLPKPGEYCPEALYTLMLRCWSEDQHARPDFLEICQDMRKIQTAQDHSNRTRDSAHGEDLYQNFLQQQIIYDIEPTPEEQDADDAEENAQIGETGKAGHKVPASPAVIRFDDLTLKQKLGEGAFGSVVQGSLKTMGKTVDVAIKTLKPAGDFNSDAFLREAEIMSQLSNPFLVRLYGVSYHTQMYLVTELVPMGPLHTYLQQNQANVPTDSLLRFATQISAGMKYMEANNFIHRDLAARNILVYSPKHCKISDFGLSRSLGCGSEYYRCQRKGKWPIKWYAPECLYETKFTSKSDVWSFGVTLWEIMSYGTKPYKGMKGQQVLKLLEKGERLQPPSTSPPWISKLMKSCWLRDPKARPTFAQLYITCHEQCPE